jgi:ribonuclease VapC
LDSPIVLDSSAVLAVLYREPGGDKVVDLMEGALLSTTNLIEVHTKLLLDGVPEASAQTLIHRLRCEFCPLGQDQAQIASEMIWETRRYGLSLGDRACLALAIQRKATVYTADRSWMQLSLGIKIEAIR